MGLHSVKVVKEDRKNIRNNEVIDETNYDKVQNKNVTEKSDPEIRKNN